jgi:hypothetical protein
MALGSNSKTNVGIRRFIYTTTPPGYRNFEPNGTQTYVVTSSHGYVHAGNAYAKGQTIAYDAAGGTLYSNLARLERSFNGHLIDPSS